MKDGEQISNAGGGTPEEVVAQQKEYDDEWDKLGDGEKSTTVPNAEGLPPETPEASLENGKEHAAEATPAEQHEEPEPKSKTYGSIESMEKALKDTKSYASRLESEKAELKKKVEALEKGHGSQAEVDEARKSVAAAQDDLDSIKTKIYEEYPEFQALLDPIIEQNKELKKKVDTLETSQAEKAKNDQRQEALDNFNNHVKPVVVQAHPDFENIVQNEDYWKWAEKQRPALRTAAMDSPDPEDIVWAVTEYKKSIASKEVPQIRKNEDANRNKRIANSATLRGSSTSFPTNRKANADPNNYDDGWDEAGETLKKQGVATG